MFNKEVYLYIYIAIFFTFLLASYIDMIGRYNTDIYKWLLLPVLVIITLLVCFTRDVFKLDKRTFRVPKEGDVLYFIRDLKLEKGKCVMIKNKVSNTSSNPYEVIKNKINSFEKGDKVKVFDVAESTYGWDIIVYKTPSLLVSIKYEKVHKYLKTKTEYRKYKIDKIR